MKRFMYNCFLVLVFSSILYAVPNTITYQGKLIDNGIPAHGAYELSFAIFDNETGGNQIWPAAGYENHNVTIENGLYTAVLGMGNPPQPITASVFNGNTAWLEVKVRTSVLPRIQIHSVPYSMQAERLSGVTPNAPGDLLMWDGTKWVTTEFKYYYRDADGDGYGDINYPIYSNKLIAGYVENSSDCFDNDNTLFPPYTYYRDADGDGLGDPNVTTTANVCEVPAGYVNDSRDCDDNNSGIPYRTLYIDSDGDGFGGSVTRNGLWCDLNQARTDGVTNITGDCDDTNPNVFPSSMGNPGAVEYCDGKDNDCDGNVDEDCFDSDGIFVSLSGSPGAPGTIRNPLSIISSALDRAVANNVKNIYIAEGTYNESLSLRSTVNLYGGYKDREWKRDINTYKTIISGGTRALTGPSASDIIIEGLYISSADAVSPGESSYGITLYSAYNIVIKNCNIISGNGKDGSQGSDGANGLNGGNGGNGQPGCENGGTLCGTCARPAVGLAGITLGGNNGGVGGQPGLSDNNGSPGAAGAGTGTSGYGGLGGDVIGNYGNCSNPFLIPYINGGNGDNGSPGINGTGGSSFGSFSTSFGYIRSNGNDGTNGTNGHGGGGGGGGHGGTYLCDSYGGSGAGGGGGGNFGNKGTGGGGGGGTFGITVYNCSNIVIQDCNITTGNGGIGGKGGTGAPGGTGGLGGVPVYGGSGEQDDGGCGGFGGKGGNGGKGGHGGGGGGGPVIGIFKLNSTVNDINNNFNLGRIGSGGIGGVFGEGNMGQDGIRQNVYSLP